MDLIKAALNTQTLVIKHYEGTAVRIHQVIENPERSEDGNGLHHAIWMLNEIISSKLTGEKAHRWLGYAQGLLVEQKVLTLQDCKYANVLA